MDKDVKGCRVRTGMRQASPPLGCPATRTERPLGAARHRVPFIVSTVKTISSYSNVFQAAWA